MPTLPRHCKNAACALLAGAFLTGWMPAGQAFAQASQQSAEQPSHIPNRAPSLSPFSHEWSKPGGTTGSYIYNDPRLRSPYRLHPKRGHPRCPGPLIYDPRSGICR